MSSQTPHSADGRERLSTDIDQALDRVQQALDRDQVPSQIYADPVIFDAEMRRIFARNWVFVAHETEIPNPGDFVLRKVGLDEVIVTRDGKGAIHVLSNHCRHRGARLCQIDKGNASHFRCPYHGWTYKNNGDWAAAPHVGEAYGGRLDAQRWGLLSAPKIGIHQGFIFTCLAQQSKSFAEYLAGAGWMLDMIAGIGPGGMRVAAPPERYRVSADWKNGAENFTGDVYHVEVAHFSTQLTNLAPDLSNNMKPTWRLDLGSGHGFLCQSLADYYGPAALYWGYSPRHRERFDFAHLDDCQKRIIESRSPVVGNIFPNLRYIRYPGPVTPGTMDLAVYTSFAQWQPVAPGVMEVWNWMFVWKFETEEEARKSYQAGQFAFSSSGVFEPDDMAVWEGIAAAARSPWHRDVGTTYQYHEGATDRFVDPAPDFQITGPARLEKNSYNEAFMLSFWREWLSLLRAADRRTE
jgi:nitrite reductase/ring-hydroxylating ferredoxin subunit